MIQKLKHSTTTPHITEPPQWEFLTPYWTASIMVMPRPTHTALRLQTLILRVGTTKARPSSMPQKRRVPILEKRKMSESTRQVMMPRARPKQMVKQVNMMRFTCKRKEEGGKIRRRIRRRKVIYD